MDDLVKKNLVQWETLPTTELSRRKAQMVYEVGLWRHMANYIGMCVFVPWSHQQIAEAVEAVTGWPMGSRPLADVVQRGIALARIFNLREGFSRNDDKLPRRFSESPQEGPLKDVSVDPAKLETAQRDYYQMLGWTEAGIPTREKLVELDIEWAYRYIKNEETES
jgi:aldehyde:ferredoxin oxidoreductase